MISSPQNSSKAEHRIIHVAQGEQALSTDVSVVMTAILGSCVAACIRDPLAGIGGMNHFLLPEGPNGASDPVKYGVHSMELLINELLRCGAVRSRLEAKIFGGACVLSALSSDCGAKNCDFVIRFLQSERIRCVGGNLGGIRARRIKYWPVSGRASLHLLAPTDCQVFDAEQQSAADRPVSFGAVELF